eukprot:CAMPEP_0119054462 /NCGR_PEP_ID=MMETSP1177-20130426/75082_1 /TAXON_ID=2985 /ORGANISM="Ochromonas sp, Strain CCMP1899" /LENGTH=267 /DNA_ID=CAMNT_0007034697 /DNA_START=67 /DNA_END=870 /DNA_ORIENTATION=-
MPNEKLQDAKNYKMSSVKQKKKALAEIHEEEMKKKEAMIMINNMGGSGIMFLNAQIKKEYPKMSINERSKKVSEIWSFMNRAEKDRYGLKGNTEWICDPNRKQIDDRKEACIINLKPDEDEVNEDSESSENENIIDKTAISLLEFPNNLSIKKRFLQPQTDSDIDKESTSANLHCIRQVIAQQVSEQSSTIPVSNSFINRNVDIDKVKIINERSKLRVKRLRTFAAKGEWKESGENLFQNALIKLNKWDKMRIRKPYYQKKEIVNIE